MGRNILVTFTDGAEPVYEPASSVRIVNRGPRPGPYNDLEKVSSNPPQRAGFGSFEARFLPISHVVEMHNGLKTVAKAVGDIDAPPGGAVPPGAAA
jgi:hypothetical protein